MEQKYKFDTLLNPVDHRNIEYRQVNPKMITIPKKYISNYESVYLSQKYDENQKFIGSCTFQGETGSVVYNQFLDTGEIKNLSRRYGYVGTKKAQGQPIIDNGVAPRDAGLFLVNTGTTTQENVPDNNDLSFEEYINVDIDKYKADANINRQKGVVFINNNPREIAEAVFKKGIVTFTILFPTTITPDGRLLNQGSYSGYHRMRIYGYEFIGENWQDVIFYYKNSWGKDWGVRGGGDFIYSEWANNLHDFQAYEDIPDKLLQEAKDKDTTFSYTFNNNLKRGIQDREIPDVYSLQTALNELGLYYNFVKGDTPRTGYFGAVTYKSVLRFQAKYGIPTTGFVGQMTRYQLNEMFSKKKISLM